MRPEPAGRSAPTSSDVAVAPTEEVRLDVWITRTDEIREPTLLASYVELLSPHERARLAGFTSRAARHQYLVTRALIRTSLSRYDRVDPRCWELTANSHGRPELAPGQSRLDLRFNASHTVGISAVVVTTGRRVGIDVEMHQLAMPVLVLADRFLARAEADDVAAQPPAQRLDRYFRYWTLRESYTKAHGIGMAMPASAFSFAIEDEAIRLRTTS
ncbi:MAG: 4'-phosphopantetheinyl transferase superfamily protein, partial [Deltaproteobacteria bacterium]|nr:4'-phosphopantetheinyl transferase superfamily protein [Nannocystaceae bacterium]